MMDLRVFMADIRNTRSSIQKGKPGALELPKIPLCGGQSKMALPLYSLTWSIGVMEYWNILAGDYIFQNKNGFVSSIISVQGSLSSLQHSMRQ